MGAEIQTLTLLIVILRESTTNSRVADGLVRVNSCLGTVHLS